MPAQYKTLISILAVVLGAVVFYFDTRSGGGTARWVALALGPAMVLAIWMFPEPKPRKPGQAATQERSRADR